MRKHLDRYSLLLQYRFELNCVALFQAYFRAENYRTFNVGTGALAYNSKDFKIFGGANIMNGKGHPKVCAEQQAIKNAFLNDYNEILIVCVVGKPQKDDQSGILSPTLHPCWECRKLMKNMYKLLDDTLIVTSTFERNGPTELFTLQDIIEYHSKRQAATEVVVF